MACSICEKRRPKRYCPAVGGEICAICCGEGREETITCPLDCEYLIEAHKHERLGMLDPKGLPNRDIPVREETLARNEALLAIMGIALVGSATEAGAVDFDLRDALDALTRTYRTMGTGIYYESRPENQIANGVFTEMKRAIDEYREAEAKETGVHRTRDAEVLELLVFLQQLEIDRNNGRKRGRAFLETISGFYPHGDGGETPEASPLILP